MSKKMIFTVIILALVAFVGFGFYRSASLQNIQIVEKTTISAPPEKVFELVQYLKNFPKWSPFVEQDPAQKNEVRGADGTIGAQFHWNGNGGKDLGFQEIVRIEPGVAIGMRCDIQKPFVAKPTFDYSFRPTASGIEVTQDFRVQSGAVDAFFMWLFSAKKEMQKTNARGLELLKKVAEG